MSNIDKQRNDINKMITMIVKASDKIINLCPGDPVGTDLKLYCGSIHFIVNECTGTTEEFLEELSNTIIEKLEEVNSILQATIGVKH